MALENRPFLFLGLNLYLEAYNELSHDRPIGMSIGSIPWSSIINWCRLRGIHDIDDVARCIRYIRTIEKFDGEKKD